MKRTTSLNKKQFSRIKNKFVKQKKQFCRAKNLLKPLFDWMLNRHTPMTKKGACFHYVQEDKDSFNSVGFFSSVSQVIGTQIKRQRLIQGVMV